MLQLKDTRGFPGSSVCLKCEWPGFNPWVGNIPWRRQWKPTPVFLNGKSHGQRSLVDYSTWGHKELDTNEWLSHKRQTGWMDIQIRWIYMLSVQFSRSVVSNSLQPHESQYTRPPCLSPTPGVHPNPCPLSRWCHPTISSSVIPFSYCPQSFLASGSFQMSQLLASGGQSIGASASTSVNEHTGLISFRMHWLGLLAVQEPLKSLLQHHSSKASILWCSVFFIVQLSHPYMTTGKTIALTIWTFVDRVISVFQYAV